MLLFGLALSAVQLSLGIVIGFWCARRFSSTGKATKRQTKENHRTATHLLELTQRVADDVHQHGDKIGNVHAQLVRADDEQTAQQPTHENVIGLVRHLTLANDHLQSQLAEAETNLQYQAAELDAQLTEARTDSLTGLANRRSFDDELEKRFAEWNRYGHNMSLMLLDVDRFKDVNDHYGHLVGDAVLKQLAHILGDARDTDIVTRYGGEEFAILLPHTSSEDAGIATERIRTNIEKMVFTHGDTKLSVSISYGLAQFEATDEVAEDIVSRADTALYASKIASRNNGHLHNGRVCLQICPAQHVEHHEEQQRAIAEAAAALQQRVGRFAEESLPQL